MFIDFVAANVSAIVAAVVFVPVLVFSVALFAEGARKTRWTPVRRGPPPAPAGRRDDAASPAARQRAASADEPRRPAPRTEPSAMMGGHGLRHGIAARRDHD